MADTVQYKLEQMVPELEDLEQRGLFNHTELKHIIKQRREFEYKLKRHSPLKKDFLDYISYENSLDQLRILRKKAIKREDNDDDDDDVKKKGKKSLSDYAGVKRVLDIYRRATVRFKGDLELWFAYLEYCRNKKNGHMKKVQADVIRLHPKVPGVWIYAAQWEFDHNLNVEAARNLMQTGLRNCPNSEDMWVEYLRMELTYLNKLKARKVALGEDKGALVRNDRKTDDKEWRDENKELFMSLGEKEENDGVVSVVEDGETNKGVDVFREQGLRILKTIYSGAVDALSSSFGLRTRFIEILEATNLDQSDEMRREIQADMRRCFSKQPEYWDWLARTNITDSSSRNGLAKEIVPSHLEKAIEVYEEAVTVVPSAIMFTLYTNFLRETITSTYGEHQSSEIEDSSDGDLDLISRVLVVYDRAESIGCVTEDLACQHVSLYMQLGKSQEAKRLAEQLCTGKLSDAIDLWVLRISIEMKCTTETSSSMANADFTHVFRLLKEVLSQLNVSKAQSLWLLALKTFTKQKDLNELVDLSMACLTRDGGSDDGFSLSSTIIGLVFQADGIKGARHIYKRYRALPHPGLGFYKKCIKLEMNLALTGDKDSLVEARKLYDLALDSYTGDVYLWQSYYSMEIKLGTSDTANAVYWRAKKQLKERIALLSTANL